MGRKKKGKTKKNSANNALREPEEITKAPHTFVVNRGHVGNSVGNLTQDMRRVMEPFTASNLKLRKKNVLKDMVAIAGPLGVTNFIMFSKTPNGTNMRIARLPRGPTLYFQVENYSLCHDILSAIKRPQTSEGQYRHPPLLVLNNFKDSEEDATNQTGSFEANPRKLCVTMLQNMFPSINIHKVKLNHVKRCVSFSYDREKDQIEFRHYNIAVKPMGMSRRLKKLIARKDIPDLSKYGDISEFLTQNPGEGSASESEAELDGPHNEVELPQNVSGSGNLLNQQSAIRLTELGPRMTLKLVKVEEGMCAGEILYHSLIVKDKEHVKAMIKRREEKVKLKAKRKAEQMKNVAKKEELREDLKKKALAGMKRKLGEDGAAEDSGIEPTPSKPDEDDDAEWYRKEVGEEPEEDLFTRKNFSGKSPAKKRKMGGKQNFTKDSDKKKFKSKKPGKDGKFEKSKMTSKSKVFGKKAAFNKRKAAPR